MNNKHIACGIVALFIVVLVQLTLWVQGNRTKAQGEAGSTQQSEADANAQLTQERSQLGELRRKSEDLIEFLKIWEPYFSTVDNPQGAEVNFSKQI